MKLTPKEKTELKNILKKTYLKAKYNYNNYLLKLAENEDENIRENIEIEKEIMRETLDKITKLKR